MAHTRTRILTHRRAAGNVSTTTSLFVLMERRQLNGSIVPCFPGGKLAWGETTAECRVLEEELGVHVWPRRIVHTRAPERHGRVCVRHLIAPRWEGEQRDAQLRGRIRARESQRLQWVCVLDLPRLLLSHGAVPAAPSTIRVLSPVSILNPSVGRVINPFSKPSPKPRTPGTS